MHGLQASLTKIQRGGSFKKKKFTQGGELHPPSETPWG